MRAYFIKRLQEPSTWAGLAALGAVFGIHPETVTTVGGAVSAVAGAAAVLLPELTK